jgi:predicted enzyme related to lactoylglutathione lyase
MSGDDVKKVNRLAHWEIPSTDLARSKDFYTRLFGWKVKDWADDYVLVEVEGGVGGGFVKVEEIPAPCIRVYIGVADVALALAKAESLGAKTVQPKTAIGGGMGFLGSFTDPCGCLVCLASQT